MPVLSRLFVQCVQQGIKREWVDSGNIFMRINSLPTSSLRDLASLPPAQLWKSVGRDVRAKTLSSSHLPRVCVGVVVARAVPVCIHFHGPCLW